MAGKREFVKVYCFPDELVNSATGEISFEELRASRCLTSRNVAKSEKIAQPMENTFVGMYTQIGSKYVSTPRVSHTPDANFTVTATPTSRKGYRSFLSTSTIFNKTTTDESSKASESTLKVDFDEMKNITMVADRRESFVSGSVFSQSSFLHFSQIGDVTSVFKIKPECNTKNKLARFSEKENIENSVHLDEQQLVKYDSLACAAVEASDYHEHPCRSPKVNVGCMLLIEKQKYNILSVMPLQDMFLCQHLDEPNQLLSVKVFHSKDQMLREIVVLKRLNQDDDCSSNGNAVQRLLCAHSFSDGSLITLAFGSRFTLAELAFRKGWPRDSLREATAAFFTLDMLKILRHLCRCKVIHGNIRPEAFLFLGIGMSKQQIEAADQADFWIQCSAACLQIADFGNAVDLNLLPEGYKFVHEQHVDHLLCCEMRDKKPWTFQIDCFGLLNSVHWLIFGCRLDAFKFPTSDHWSANISTRCSWDAKMWSWLFDTFLNIGSDIEQQLDEAIRLFSSCLAEQCFFLARQVESLRQLVA
ncbi:Mitotic checkpoint serine/threonine-protein kinase BUB1 [Trichinella patagoniensis]|uniref:Mitotic checkpoint serine/threonine-protein kinase BUB1 n=1 Tax=Trichinella patagoniensis TaxID=990121 RepID=A0A0V1AGP9_9BILA|nr:Mitotic checkpoint serine/threonine-protein kinase BUB1 [Trichinella patagoniensis]